MEGFADDDAEYDSLLDADDDTDADAEDDSLLDDEDDIEAETDHDSLLDTEANAESEGDDDAREEADDDIDAELEDDTDVEGDGDADAELDPELEDVSVAGIEALDCRVYRLVWDGFLLATDVRDTTEDTDADFDILGEIDTLGDADSDIEASAIERIYTSILAIFNIILLSLYIYRSKPLRILLLVLYAMEFAIPISRFNSSYVTWGTPRNAPFRRTVPFGYSDAHINLNNVIVLLQPLQIVELDWARKNIVLEETARISYLSKLDQFQTTVASTINQNYKGWLDSSIKNPQPLQPWLKGRRLTLYLSAQPDTLPFFTEDGPAVFSSKTIKPGDSIRAVVKLQGLSLQMSEDDTWTGRSRIQHHIVQLYKVSNPCLQEQ